MTIQRRLSVSFLVILGLFALNLVIYFWGNQRRETTVEALRRAVSRQALISGLNQSLRDIQKQVTLLGQIATESTPTTADPAEIVQINAQLQRVEAQIDELRGLADPEARNNVNTFADEYRRLSASWKTFYESFGRDQTKAITELVVRAEPMAQQVFQTRLPQLQNDENARVDAASINFYHVARLTNRTALLIFAVSAMVAIAVAFGVSRQLTQGLFRLKAGATSIGGGDLDHRIELRNSDELADLANTFNEMATHLLHARDQLTLANTHEKKKSEELAKALDQLHKAQDQLVVQQKLASLGSLTAGIAHEIKNPLNFVTNFAEVSLSLVNEIRDMLGETTVKIEAKDREYVGEMLQDLEQNVSKIQEHGKRADRIIRNMLMHSRGQSGERQTADINALLMEYVKLAYHGMRAQNTAFNVTLEEDLDRSIEPIEVYPSDLCRVFLNIANNACYSAFEKKKRLGNEFSPVVRAATRNKGTHVEVRLRDNGDGIPDTVKERIFEPFFTTKPTGSGTGLGLSMSYEIIVQQHKGSIRIDSQPGNFAEFIITLPKQNS